MALIDSDRWRIVSPYLDQALELTEERERDAWLAAMRARDPLLAADVEALLANHQAARDEGFLEGSVGPSRGPDVPGAIVGAYTLVSPIGSGGMGTVWLAERSDGRFERRVAIKFLNRALSGGEDRFKREGAILGRLAHPHIAQLLDAGVTESGQPYLVLEHVDGEPIDRYCDRHGLDVPARLRLFLDVLDAVAHAHALLIVHRDIKPPNVLVTSSGEVKLLDFGIAKLLEDDDGAASGLTIETRAMTPAYAAPEQVTGQPVSTATDVYALGVLLYLLVSGRHPAGDGLQSPADLVKAIVDTDPMRPSDVVTRDRGAATASHRATSPDKLHRLLRGDIDTIVSTALKKQPAERYASVTAFADDVRRHLGHEPIRARPDSVTYRSAKFVRRNRLVVAAAVIVLATLSAGLYAVNRERIVAERRFQQVRQLANRVLTLDSQIRGLPGSTKARHEIVAISQQYLQALRADAQGDPVLALEIATAYRQLAYAQGVPSTQNLGQFDQAERSLLAADALLGSVLAASPKNTDALIESADIAQALVMVLDTQRRYEQSGVQVQRTAARLERLLETGQATPAQLERAVQFFATIALAQKNAKHYQESIAYARRSLAITAPTFARAYEISAQNLSIIADSQRLSGDVNGALDSIREARRNHDRATFPGDVNRWSSLFNILWRQGLILGEEGRVSLGRTDEAIDSLQEAFDVIEAWAKLDADDGKSRILFGQAGRELGELLRRRDPARSLAVYDLALRRLGEIRDNLRARRGEVELLAGSSYALQHMGRSVEAEQRLNTAFERLKKLGQYPVKLMELGFESEVAVRARADYHAATGNVAAAIASYREILEGVTATAAPETDLPDAAGMSRVYESMAVLHRRAGKSDVASEFDARRRQLWQGWDRKLPNHAYIKTQLAAVDVTQ